MGRPTGAVVRARTSSKRNWILVLVVVVVICAVLIVGRHTTPGVSSISTTDPAPVVPTTGIASASQDALVVRTFNVDYAKWVTKNVIAHERSTQHPATLSLYQKFIHLSGTPGPQVLFASASVALFSFNSGPNVCMGVPQAVSARLRVVACPKGSS